MIIERIAAWGSPNILSKSLFSAILIIILIDEHHPRALYDRVLQAGRLILLFHI
jgi:hypothetical protein